jgi:decaprenylphospho-beta-D-erythro-pentofuranosid-2-ulose 2-reductase
MLNIKKKIVIIGATSCIAEHCARLWAKDTLIDLILVGRDLEKTERVAADLRVRSPQSYIRALKADFIDPRAIKQLVDEIAAEDPVHTVLIAHGLLPDQVLCQQDLTECHEALTVNGISPVLFAEAFAGHMQRVDHGNLVIIGSVAGDRGRKTNYVYGSAKGLIARYAQGLQHRLANTGVRVVLIKPGPTNTPMTQDVEKKAINLASVESVAEAIVVGIERQNHLIYAPAKWFWIIMVIRHMPSFIFNKMDI